MMRFQHRLIRVVVADTHPVVLEGIRSFLARDAEIEMVGIAEDGVTALHMVQALRPDVLILDIRLPNNGIDVARQVHNLYPEVATLILSSDDDLGDVRTLLRLGIKGYLHKSVRFE